VQYKRHVQELAPNLCGHSSGSLYYPHPQKGFASGNPELDLCGRLSKKMVERDHPILCKPLNGDVRHFVGLNFGNKFVSLCALFHSYSCLFMF
jgi:hypothetical protein